ncbi:MAG: glutaminyl-peptide cyclotransferase [Gemmatimonadaceae bacterium]|nr:glutaminyl-peptide cyclotransferase [Gemmatimonadaceae bacterium]
MVSGIATLLIFRPSPTSGSAPLDGASLAPRRTNADATPPAIPFDATTPRLVVRATKSIPHDTAAFTQGLLFHGQKLLESTGLEGRSDIREVDALTGIVRRRVPLNVALFGEGIAVAGERLYQLTWQSGKGFVYDAASLAPIDSFAFTGEGWGLTSDRAVLYMSDGTDRIRVFSAPGFTPIRSIHVTEAGHPVWMLNELEWVRGELWANVYQTDLIARIDSQTGAIRGWIDLSALHSIEALRALRARGAVANGIAIDTTHRRVVVTGKLWPWMYEFAIPSPLMP